MQISDILNKEELTNLIVNELNNLGVKHRKEKKRKNHVAAQKEKSNRKRIFRQHLHLLELTDVFLASSGNVVQIPKFVADSCHRILEQIEIEGIFRKAGSASRQKEIRLNLEAGHSVNQSHHVIDVANVVKFFFRELPEPLIQHSIQETFLRSFLIGEHRVYAILLSCLLLPTLTINTMAFFMQFLLTVSQNSNLNKMSAENLAIIFTPGLMPFNDLTSHRFTNHIKVIQLLIENANSIGTIPDRIIEKLQINEIALNTPSSCRSRNQLTLETLEEPPATTQKMKKKKRRSEMFNGIKKIVGSAIGSSSENLENTPENKLALAMITTTSTTTTCSSNKMSDANKTQQQQQNQCEIFHLQPAAPTPFLSKSSKKRKFADPVCVFSAKKKKDLLALLPSNSGGFLPNTPMTKEAKKSRLSFGGPRHTKATALNIHHMVPSIDRRWSIVGSGWSKQKLKNSQNLEIKQQQQRLPSEQVFESSFENTEPLTTNKEKHVDVALINKYQKPKSQYPIVENFEFGHSVFTALPSPSSSSPPTSLATTTATMAITSTTMDCRRRHSGGGGGSFSDSELLDESCVRVPKNEYEAIKERVAALEARISEEFGTISNALADNNKGMTENGNSSSGSSRIELPTSTLNQLSGPEWVQHQFEKMLVETEALTSPGTEQLAKRLSRDLKIRRSMENRIPRSPSARKIGTMRRRSQDKVRLSRNPTWHISSTATLTRETKPMQSIVMPNVEISQHHHQQQPPMFYTKSNLKRGRPNSRHAGLVHTPVMGKPNENVSSNGLERHISDEQWTSGEVFFNNINVSRNTTDFVQHLTEKKVQHSATPMTNVNSNETTPIRPIHSSTKIGNKGNIITPMLPPKSLPRRNLIKTPNSGMKSITKDPSFSRLMMSTPVNNDGNGRASIARLRTQNAGMVMAKAKLFDGLGGSSGQCNNSSLGVDNTQMTNAKKFPQTPHSIKLTKSNDHKSSSSSSSFKATTSNMISNSIAEDSTEFIVVDGDPSDTLSPRSPRQPKFKRQRTNFPLTKYPNKVILQTAMKNEDLIKLKDKSEKSLQRAMMKQTGEQLISSPRTPKIRKHLNINSPRIAQRNRNDRFLMSTNRGGVTATNYKNSPRRYGKSKLEIISSARP